MIAMWMVGLAMAKKPPPPGECVSPAVSLHETYYSAGKVQALQVAQAGRSVASASGSLYVRVESLTIDGGNTDHLTFAVVQGDTLVGEQVGPWDVADAPASASTGYTNSWMVPLPDGVAFPALLRVTHRSGLICDLYVDAAGNASAPPR